jgi:predicted MPP superfamily phosphohydrolase
MNSTLYLAAGAVSSLMGLYASWSLLRRATIFQNAAQRIALIAFITVASGFLCFMVGQEQFFSRETAASLVPAAVFFACFAPLLFLAALTCDIVALVRTLLARRRGQAAPGKDTFSLVLLVGLLVLAMVFAVVGGWNGLGEAFEEEQKVYVKGLPEGLEGFRIVQVSDLHASPVFNAERTAALVKRINAMKPDAVVITGNSADGQIELRGPDLAPLKDLRSTYGTYAVPGRFDYLVGWGGLKEIYKAAGVTVLENGGRALDVKGTKLLIAGIADPSNGIRTAVTEEGAEDAVTAALAAAPDAAFKVLLANNSLAALEASRHGVQLQISSLAPGAQFDLWRRLAGGTKAGLLPGLFRYSGMLVFASQGEAVWSGLPMRLGTWNEVNLITLTGKPVTK